MSEAQARELWAHSGAFFGTRRPQAPDETRQRQPRSSPDSLLFGSAIPTRSSCLAVTIGTLYLHARISPLFDIVATRV